MPPASSRPASSPLVVIIKADAFVGSWPLEADFRESVGIGVSIEPRSELTKQVAAKGGVAISATLPSGPRNLAAFLASSVRTCLHRINLWFDYPGIP
jgi:hypothetical protein